MYLHRTIDAGGSLKERARRIFSKKNGSPDDAALADGCWSAYYMLADHVRAPKHSNRPARSQAVDHGSMQPSICLIYAPHRCSTLPDRIGRCNLDRAAAMQKEPLRKPEIEPPIALCRALILTMHSISDRSFETGREQTSPSEFTAGEHSWSHFVQSLSASGDALDSPGPGDGWQ